MSRIAVLGASGFVGSHVAAEAERRGHEVTRLRAPRLTSAGVAGAAARDLATALADHDVVVNCAGEPDASSTDRAALDLVNGVLPGVIGEAARLAQVARFVHVSSAVVQGRREVLDSSDEVDPFSPYARSKVAGERSAAARGPVATTAYRPPSVHAPDRRVTRQLTRIARSPLSSVAFPGDDPTPQAHVRDVASAVVYLATAPTPPPSVVHHPSQGLTTAGLLTALGDGRRPTVLPRFLVRYGLAAARGAARVLPLLSPYARRVELTWIGQRQARSWLEDQGWTPVTSADHWRELGRLAGMDNHRRPRPGGRR